MTKNFKLEEFLHSKFYKEAGVQDKVIRSYNNNKAVQDNLIVLSNQLQVIRDEINKPIIINIAYRPLWWEKRRGRSGNSQHILGKAADIVVRDLTTIELHNIITNLIKEEKIINGGLGLYNSFIHYDIRPYPVRWKVINYV